jgi:hypothetical protein
LSFCLHNQQCHACISSFCLHCILSFCLHSSEENISGSTFNQVAGLFLLTRTHKRNACSWILCSPLMHIVTFEHLWTNSFTQTRRLCYKFFTSFVLRILSWTIFGNHMLASTYILFLHAGGSFSLGRSQVTQAYQYTGRKVGKKNRMCYTNILQQCVKTHEKCF